MALCAVVTAMIYPFTVRRRSASGVNEEDRFPTEFEAIRPLQSVLEGHRKSGNTVIQPHLSYIYVVADSTGNVVPRTELVFPA
jgi:hypothetical protein